MTYQLQADEALGKGLRRIAVEELDGAIARLRNDGHGPGDVRESGNTDGRQGGTDRVADIHEARKHIKKTRSALRFVRSELGDKRYRKQNKQLRGAAQRLSDVRDAQVAVKTLDKLAPGRFPKIEERLRSRAAAATEAVSGRSKDVEASVRDLVEAQQKAQRWRLPKDRWRVVGPGLLRGHERGAKAFAALGKKPDVEALHAWRKRVKDLWYHLRILTPVWPGPLDEFTEQVHQLSELLGDDHDLAMLRQSLRTHSGAKGEIPPLVKLIDRRRGELQRDARRLGQRVYAEKSKAFERRLRRYWQVWREETAEHARSNREAPDGSGQLEAPALGSTEPLRVTPPPPPADAEPEPQLEAPTPGTFEQPADEPTPSTATASTPTATAAPGTFAPAATASGSTATAARTPEPQLAAPAPGSYERPVNGPARAAIIAAEPQLAPPALGSFERPVNGPAAATTTAAESQLPVPALGTIENGDAGQDPLPPSQAEVKQTDTVYATRTGARFHRGNCPLLVSGPRALEREEAVQEGLLPCRTCHP